VTPATPRQGAQAVVIEKRVRQLFAMVREALAGATFALLNGDMTTGQIIADADKLVDDLTNEVSTLVWEAIESGTAGGEELRAFVALLLILPELERSADLAEHIARRAADNLGPQMSPATRGFIQQMSDVASDMWRKVSLAYEATPPDRLTLDDADDEIDALHLRLTLEVGAGTMPPGIAGQVALVGRFYERLGDHAVNLARRIAQLSHS